MTCVLIEKIQAGTIDRFRYDRETGRIAMLDLVRSEDFSP